MSDSTYDDSTRVDGPQRFVRPERRGDYGEPNHGSGYRSYGHSSVSYSRFSRVNNQSALSVNTAAVEPGALTLKPDQKKSSTYQVYRPQTAPKTVIKEDDFPAFPPKRTMSTMIKSNATSNATSNASAIKSTATTVVPSKPTFAQLATEWTKKIQDEKAEQEAAAIAEAKRLAEEQRDKDNGLMERIKRINLVKKNNQKKDTKQLDIGCASSDHSENEAYNSQDDLTYEEEEDEDEEDEEDGDALWNYRRNKNEMY